MSFYNTDRFCDTNFGFCFKFGSVIWQTDWSRQYPDHKAAKILFNCVKEATLQQSQHPPMSANTLSKVVQVPA